MDRKPIVTLSNSTHALLSSLRRDLFSPPQKPFEKKVVFLPDLSLKNSLMQALVSEGKVQVIMGIDFVELGEGVQLLLSLCAHNPLFFPSLELLTLELETILDTPSLAPSLALEFLRYGKFGGAFLKQWTNHWQKKVWDQVFSKWNYLYQILDVPLKKPEMEVSVFLFHFSFLPKLYSLFFDRISPYFPIRFYQFSPCAEFWSDGVTDFEKMSLLKKNPTLASYLEEDNFFLANFGKMGRENIRVLEEEDFIFEEVFELPSKKSHLALFQTDILKCKKGNGLKEKEDKREDRSILLLPAPSKLREVEILYTKLLEEEILPSDIQVFAPDMSAYAPLIDFVFGAEDSPYAYALYDTPGDPFVKVVLDLLALDRFEPESVFSLLSSPYFSPLSKDEVRTFASWIAQCGVKWGVDLAHRKALLPHLIDETEDGTWQKGFDALLDTLIAIPPHPSDWAPPYLNFSEAELLGKGIWIIHSLRTDLDSLKSALLTGAQWAEELPLICARYFNWEEGEERGFRKSLSSLKEIKKPFPLPSLQRYLSTYLKQKKRGKSGPNLNSISFRSLRSGGIFSSKVIALLGMEEGSFPRASIPSSLNLLGKKGDYCPTPTDEDRYLFLQAVLSAKETLWIFYQNVSEEDGKEQFPPLIAEELQPKVEGHPPFPAHRDSFSSSKPRPLRTYQVAKKIYHLEENPPFVPEYLYPTSLVPSKERPRPSLQILERFAKHPIRFYFQDILGMYLQSDGELEGEFFLSSLQKYRLLQKKGSLEEAERFGRLPLGRFKEVAKKKMEQEWEETLSIETTPYFLTHFQESLPIAKEGFPLLGQPTLQGLIQVYPLYLAVCCENPIPLFSCAKKKAFHLKRDPQNALDAYLDYYQLGCNTPSPLLPLFAPLFLQKGASDFAKGLKKLSNDPYCEHLFRDPTQYNPWVIFDTWVPVFRKTFAPLLEMLE